MLVKNLILAFYLVAVMFATREIKNEGGNYGSGIFLLIITFLGIIS